MHAALADQRVVADQFQRCIADLARHRGIVVVTVRKIDQQVAAAVALEGIAMQPRAQRRGQLGENVVVLQVYLVVARLRLLLVVARAVARRRAVPQQSGES